MYHCLQIMTVKEAPQVGGRGAAATGQRPKSVQQWSVVDVQKWLRRHCGDYYHLYAESFLEQEVGPGHVCVNISSNMVFLTLLLES